MLSIEVQAELVRTKRHRVPILDLLIASASESASLTLLHYDSDFDTVASVTGQTTKWVVREAASRSSQNRRKPTVAIRTPLETSLKNHYQSNEKLKPIRKETRK